MKNIYKIIVLTLILSFSATSCNLDLENPNAATEDQVLKTKDGLFALAIGIRQLYSTSVLSAAILYPSVTARETAAMTTFSSLEELEEGGPQLSGENERIERLFSRTARVKGMAESLLANLDAVSLDAGTKAGLQGYASLFRAMALGVMAYNWEQVPLQNSPGNDAAFSERKQAFNEAIAIINNAISALEANPASDEYDKVLGGSIDLMNALYAYSARFNLMAGNNDEAIAMANKVDMTSSSFFSYDGQNSNPVYGSMFVGTVQYAPRVDFGLPAGLTPDAGDQRVAFYLHGGNGPSLNNLPVDTLVCSFYTGETNDVPVYLPGEMLLIKAEAYARKNDITNAETALNALRQTDPATAPFGVGAGLTDTYASGGDQAALLNEIFKNRRIELFLSGVSLEDSRRFARPDAPTTPDFNSERNRNFYPYPESERQSNSNTPSNPSI